MDNPECVTINRPTQRSRGRDGSCLCIQTDMSEFGNSSCKTGDCRQQVK